MSGPKINATGGIVIASIPDAALKSQAEFGDRDFGNGNNILERADAPTIYDQIISHYGLGGAAATTVTTAPAPSDTGTAVIIPQPGTNAGTVGAPQPGNGFATLVPQKDATAERQDLVHGLLGRGIEGAVVGGFARRSVSAAVQGASLGKLATAGVRGALPVAIGLSAIENGYKWYNGEDTAKVAKSFSKDVIAGVAAGVAVAVAGFGTGGWGFLGSVAVGGGAFALTRKGLDKLY